MDIAFYCQFCSSVSSTINEHLIHSQTHRHIATGLLCGFQHCRSILKNEAALRGHVIRLHKVYVNKRKCSMLELSSDLINRNAKFLCPIESCGQEFFLERMLMGHMKQHLKSGIKAPCPVQNCNKQFSTLNSLTGHISKKHKKASFSSSQPIIEDVPVNYETNAQPNDTFDESFTVETIPEPTKEESLVALAQFFQKLEYKHIVPEITVQIVAKEMKTLLEGTQTNFLNNLKIVLQGEEIPSEQIHDIISEMSVNCSVLEICHTLRTTYMRKKFFKSRFQFVVPIEVPLYNDTFFYYVPMKDTVQAAFENKSWDFNISASPPSQDGVYRDFKDGEAFKNNEFFNQNPDAIPLILYQDAFELVIPIGPAKNLKHKVIGFYLAFGNLPPEVRFQKDNIQLLALCKECDFDHDLVYGKIVEDICELQEEGIQIKNVGNVKVGVAFIAGDNLGSHSLGGFVENFSTSIYFCRYCLVSRKLFFKAGGETRMFETRTEQSYKNALQKLRATTNKKVKSCQGVKFDSEFNLVKGFHVCSPGLPNCLGHDLAEGVIAYDLMLFIQYFITDKKWFTLEELNHMITSFPYSEEDKRDKPIIIKSLKKKKLAGGAWQLWTFLKLFPLIVYGNVKDFSDPVWKCLLQLTEITKIAVAPEIHESHLPGYQCLIYDYLIARREVFPNVPLRPKHHYLSHYPMLIHYFGPAIKVWTLRFESKHPFFKRCWKCSNNSINVLKTLSFKHEFLQSWLRCGSGSKRVVESGVRGPFIHALYSDAIKKAVEKSAPVSQFEECSKICIKGTSYKKGDYVVLKQSNFGEMLQVGIIHLILIDAHDKVKFVVKKGVATRQHLIGAYKVHLLNVFECHDSQDLLCYYPLHAYIRDTFLFLCLKHALVNETAE